MNKKDFDTVLRNFEAKKIYTFSIIGVIISLLFRVDDENSYFFYFSLSIAVIFMFSFIFLPLKHLIYSLIILMVSMQDLTQSSEDVDLGGFRMTATPWQFFVGPFNPSFFVLLVLIVCFFRLYKTPLHNKYNIFFIYYFIFLSLISIIFGSLVPLNRFVADLKIPLFFLISLIVFESYFQRFPESVVKVTSIFFAFCISNYLIDIAKLILNTNESNSSIGYANLSLDSGKALLCIISLWAISRLLEGRSIVFNFLFLISSLYVLLAYQTRWLVITFFLGIIILLFYLGIFRTFIFSIPIVLVISFTIPFLIQLMPEVWRIAVLRFSFIEDLSTNASLENIEQVRAASIYNSMNTLYENNLFLTGMGYGSWYNDSYYPMPLLTISGFDQDSISSGRFYRVHDFFFNFVFKFGVFGLFIYLSLYLKPLIWIWNKRNIFRENKLSRNISIVFLGSFPTILTYMWFTGKGLMICSFFIVIVNEWLKIFKQKMYI